MKNKFTINEELLKASIIGFVVGDALGVPVEFENRNELKENPVLTMEEYGSHYQPKGTWSDDSSMVLATMNAIVKDKSDDFIEILNTIASEFVNWAVDCEYTPFGIVFDIGGTTSIAISNFKRTKDALKCGLDQEFQNGNGSLMRIIPAAFYGLVKCKDEKEFDDFIFNVSAITHSHIYSKISCLVYSKYIEFLLELKDKTKAYLKLQDWFRKYEELNKDYSDDLKKFSRILKEDISRLSEKDIESSGFVLDTLEAVLWSILTTNNYKEAVLKAINLGDDTDTIGALTGGLAGIIYGYSDIPLEWINDLQKKDYIMDLIDKFNNKINNNSFDLDLLNDTINDLQTNPDVCTLTKYENSEENVITIQESKPDEQLTKFIKYLYDTNKMDSNYKKKDIESKKISEMNYEDILTKLTFIIRGDRFCSGNLYSYVKNGEFLELLLRLRNLIMEEVFR